MFYRPFIPLALFLSVLAAPELAASQALGSNPSVATGATVQDAKGLNDWLRRMHEASKNRAYIGTYVVSSGGQMQSAKIWHVCEAGQQTERIETLTGAPRSTFRHNEQVVTFLPDQKLVRHAKREALSSFPEIVQSSDNHISAF